MTPWRPDAVCIERSELDTPIARTVRERVPSSMIHLVDDARAVTPGEFAAAKRVLMVQRHRGEFLRYCPAGTAAAVCCNYLVLSLANSCPFDCSYCFLQAYLANNPALRAFTNVDDALAELDQVLRAHPGRMFRIGTGEWADSLALDPVTGLSRFLVPFFAERPNAVLELKTKTDSVDELVGLDPKGRVVVSWSVNAPEIVTAEEPGTASLADRLVAARRVQDAGYRVGFHFDPLVEFDGWEDGYRAVIEAVFATVDPGRIAWISLGSLRLTPPLEGIIRSRGRSRYVLSGELVPGVDGKARVWRGLRIRMYRSLLQQLHAVDPRLPIYLCTEPASVWQRVMGEAPVDRQLGTRLLVRTTW